MVDIKLMVVALVIGLFALIVAWMILAERKSRTAQRQALQSLGLSPLEPSPELAQQIAQLYQNIRKQRLNSKAEAYELRHVFGKRIQDGELFVFDLINRSGNEDSVTENQAVAIRSTHLHLPPFMIVPKSDIPGLPSDLGNKLLAWVVERFGNLVEFPQAPEFTQRYLVSSPEPEAVRQFLDETRLRRLAKTRLVGVHAGGDIFTLSRMDMMSKTDTRQLLSERIDQAQAVYTIFIS